MVQNQAVWGGAVLWVRIPILTRSCQDWNPDPQDRATRPGTMPRMGVSEVPGARQVPVPRRPVAGRAEWDEQPAGQPPAVAHAVVQTGHQLPRVQRPLVAVAPAPLGLEEEK